MATITSVSEKILQWQKNGGTLNVSRVDLDRLVKEQFDQAMLLIASITDLQQPKQRDQINYEAESIQWGLIVYDKESMDRWKYLKGRFEVLLETGLLNQNLSRDLSWRFQ